MTKFIAHPSYGVNMNDFDLNFFVQHEIDTNPSTAIFYLGAKQAGPASFVAQWATSTVMDNQASWRD